MISINLVSCKSLMLRSSCPCADQIKNISLFEPNWPVQGGILVTDSNLDFAISGSGFFILNNPVTGELNYTRDGNFTIDSNDFLIHKKWNSF